MEQDSCLRLVLNKLKEIGGVYLYLYPLGDLTLGGFYAWGFHVATNQGSFSKGFLITMKNEIENFRSELKVN